MHLVLATTNPGKLKELRALLAPLSIEVSPQSSFTAASVAETGLSFVENAILKARHAAMSAGLPAIADDSGLEVDALQGRPGILSARYAGEGASDEDNLRKLIDEISQVPPAQRSARYRCAMVFMRWARDPSPVVCQASWEGRIIEQPIGEGGFGYDPIFELPNRNLTAAQLSPEEKNSLSHRGKALRQLLAELQANAAVPSLRHRSG